MAALMLPMILLASSPGFAAGEPLERESDSRLPSIDPFVYVGLVDSQTGGFPGRVESFYAARANRVQLSSESTDGRLHRLAEARADTTRIFDALREVPTGDPPSPGKA